MRASLVALSGCFWLSYLAAVSCDGRKSSAGGGGGAQTTESSLNAWDGEQDSVDSAFSLRDLAR